MSSETASTPGEKSLRLVIKTANHHCSDLNVKCEDNWTVKDLKVQIAAAHPVNPPASQQRLVCAGKLLADHLKLTDVLGQIDRSERMAVHLVLSPHFHRSMSSPVNLQGGSETPTHQQPVTSGFQSPVGQQDGLRHRGMQYNPAGYSPAGVPFSYSPGFWMHPAYMHQMAAAAAASGHSPPAETPVGPYVGNEPSRDPSPSPAAPQPAREPVDQERPANNRQVLNANAAGGFMVPEEEDEDDAVARDWLDKIYMLFRAGLLLTIFYFYSSSFRFSLAIVIIVLIFLYQSGWFRIRRRAGVPIARANQQDNRNLGANQAAQRPVVGDEGEALDVEQQPGVLATLMGFFVSFFTSLVPQNPQVLVGN